MKNSSFENLNLRAENLLPKGRLKTILGGAMASCTADCGNNETVTCEGEGICVAVDGESGYCTINGVASYCPT